MFNGVNPKSNNAIKSQPKKKVCVDIVAQLNTG